MDTYTESADHIVSIFAKCHHVPIELISQPYGKEFSEFVQSETETRKVFIKDVKIKLFIRKTSPFRMKQIRKNILCGKFFLNQRESVWFYYMGLDFYDLSCLIKK